VSRFHSYILSSIKIIETYKGEGPFALHLKKHFAENKKYGSTDRKTIGKLCYSYFRAAYLFSGISLEDKILNTFFVCEGTETSLLKTLRPELNEKVGQTLAEKCLLLKVNPEGAFPFTYDLSAEMRDNSFYNSFFYQPSLFLRIRPGKNKIVEGKLTAAAILFTLKGENCIELKNSIPVDTVIHLNKEAVVQDASSQKVFDYLNESSIMQKSHKVSAWDCCAASGGKSILLYDKLNRNVQLTVSDIRENILHNCRKRLSQAGINIYKSFIADLTKANSIKDEDDKFPIIICDVPCSGSGTWARTPEQLSFFKLAQLDQYVERQKLIVKNAHQHLTKGGLFFYITCSVFTKENENVVEFIKEKTALKLLSTQYIKGFEIKADTMFVAVFTL
jgi:16S rRNA (cytosine967-C5)-methyltransferase